MGLDIKVRKPLNKATLRVRVIVTREARLRFLVGRLILGATARMAAAAAWVLGARLRFEVRAGRNLEEEGQADE